MKRLFKLSAAVACFAVMSSASAADVNLYTYHGEPPFVTGGNAGLTYELASYLTRKSNGALTVKVSLLPRARVDQAVQDAGFNDAVAWVFPMWFKDKDKTTYLWSDPIFADENIIVSTTAKKVDYTGPDALKGLSFAGVLGHKYAGIDDLVTSGAIQRQDAQNEETNLRKVAAGRADATLLPASSANFLMPQLAIADKVFVSPNPQSKYTRHLLISKKNPDLLKQVNAIIAEMKKDPAWQEIVRKYKIKG